MQGRLLALPLLTFDSATRFSFSSPDLATTAPNIARSKVNISCAFSSNVIGVTWPTRFVPKTWVVNFAAQISNVTLSDEESKTWEACREALSAFDLKIEEKDKMLTKAFGHVHSPYWGEERKKEVPKLETVSEILDYLRSLGLSDDDLYKLLKKFPEVLGCSLERELRTNVKILEKDWGIKGKSLRSLLLRNPKVLGYNVDCKGDCMAQCTRCWVRF